MTKLKKLIKELCPNGVEYSSIGSVISRVRNKGKDDENVTQVYVVSNTQGMVRAEEYRENTIHSEDTSNYTIIRENMVAYNPSRLNIGSIARLKYSESGLVSPMYVVFSIDSSKMLYEYFDYLIKSSYVTGKIDSLKEEGARFRFDFSRWDLIMVPIPPIPVQKEIVRILNNFRELIVELTAELTARKKQYEYYADKLFKSDIPRDEWKTVEETIVSLRTGLNPRQNFRLNDGGDKPYITGKDIYNNSINVSSRTDLITDDAIALINRRACLATNDVLFASTGTGTVGRMAVIEDYDNTWAVSETMFCLKPRTEIIEPHYLMYALYMQSAKEQFEPKISKGSVPHLKVKDLLSVKISVPNLREQEQIVAMMRRFDSLCNDITTGLPAEIEARQNQYEYYRDKLLTFKELSV